jgi:hypothetical protein
MHLPFAARYWAACRSAHAASDALFAGLLRELRELLLGYTDAQLETILSFLTDTRAVFARPLERRGR